MERHFLDPETQQAAHLGIVEEGAEPRGVTARVRLIDRQIAEAEWYLARKGRHGIQGPAAADGSGANLFDPQSLIANPPPEERNAPRREQPARASLLGVANCYFDAIRRSGLSEYSFIENGLISRVYAAMFYPAPSQPIPNWPPYDGNCPLPVSVGEGRWHEHRTADRVTSPLSERCDSFI